LHASSLLFEAATLTIIPEADNISTALLRGELIQFGAHNPPKDIDTTIFLDKSFNFIASTCSNATRIIDSKPNPSLFNTFIPKILEPFETPTVEPPIIDATKVPCPFISVLLDNGVPYDVNIFSTLRPLLENSK
jgi:hypothetical protein